MPHMAQARRLHKFEAIRAWGRGGGSGGKSDYSLGDAGAMWDRVGLPSRMCSARTVRSSRQPASCLTILPPRTECSVVSLTPRGAAFGGRSIRMEFDLNGRRQAAVIMVFPPCVDCTEGLPTPAATWVRAFFGGPILTVDKPHLSLQCRGSNEEHPDYSKNPPEPIPRYKDCEGAYGHGPMRSLLTWSVGWGAASRTSRQITLRACRRSQFC